MKNFQRILWALIAVNLCTKIAYHYLETVEAYSVDKEISTVVTLLLTVYFVITESTGKKDKSNDG